MIVIGIETSCDETGIGIYDSNKGVLANTIYSQIKFHNRYGGVVPELASREHVIKIISVIESVLKSYKFKFDDIDLISYTKGPGLIGSLLIGSFFSKIFSYIIKKPIIGINHLEGHLLSVFLNKLYIPEFPFICLLVSGGHTMLFKVINFCEYFLLGETLDDSAGESFDKIAKCLNLNYPGGPEIEKLSNGVIYDFFKFTRSFVVNDNLDFSFSGLKTSVVNLISKVNSKKLKREIAYSFQEAIIDILLFKCKKAIELTKIKNLVIVGGVSSNKRLRKKIGILKILLNVNIFFPKYEFCKDNGAMIAFAGYKRFKNGHYDKYFFSDIFTTNFGFF